MTLAVPNQAMAIVAHPDDCEFLCGGTIAKWCKAGTEMSYLILTNGNKGSDDPDMTSEKLAVIRRKEQHAAANALGVKHVMYLGEPDGELQQTLALRKRVVTEIRRFRPEIVITFDPTRYFVADSRINHADHRVAGEIAIDAIFPAARNRMYHPELLAEGLEPHTVLEVYLMVPEQPNRWVDISEFIDTKIKAILCHASQFDDPDSIAERVRDRHRSVDQYGRQIFREEFRVLRIG